MYIIKVYLLSCNLDLGGLNKSFTHSRASSKLCIGAVNQVIMKAITRVLKNCKQVV